MALHFVSKKIRSKFRHSRQPLHRSMSAIFRCRLYSDLGCERWTLHWNFPKKTTSIRCVLAEIGQLEKNASRVRRHWTACLSKGKFLRQRTRIQDRLHAVLPFVPMLRLFWFLSRGVRLAYHRKDLRYAGAGIVLERSDYVKSAVFN